MTSPGDTIQLETRPLMPAFGVEILDVDIAAADRETLSEVATLLFRHGAIVLRGQSLDQSAQVAFTRFSASRPETIIRNGAIRIIRKST